MYRCPDCAKPTITFTRKWLSWNASPAVCIECKRGCTIPTVDASGALASWAVLFTLCGFLAIAVQAVYPLVLGAVAVTSYYFWRQHQAPLHVVSASEQKNAKRSFWLMVLLSLFPRLFS
jgi:hypothetical protein